MATKGLCRRCLQLTATGASQSTYRTPFYRAFSTSVTRSLQRSTPHQHATPTTEASRTTASDVTSTYVGLNQAASDLQDELSTRALLQKNNLFHPFSKSPSSRIRKRAAFMRQNAYCPHPDHQATRAATSPNDLELRKTGSMAPAHVHYECPDCGIPVSCSEEHFVDDYESHLEICHILRQINEDDHDLVSGRFFAEYDYPGAQIDEAQANLTNWDTLFYSREFEAVNDERALRQVTRLMTYPATIASVLHELSPYGLKNGLTPEGLRSLSGKRTIVEARMSALLTFVYSASIYLASTSNWCQCRHQRSSTKPTACTTFHSRCPRRIEFAARSVASIGPFVSSLDIPLGFHWTRINGESGARVPVTGAHPREPIWCYRRG
jgi:splicing suppressor protein 51